MLALSANSSVSHSLATSRCRGISSTAVRRKCDGSHMFRMECKLLPLSAIRRWPYTSIRTILSSICCIVALYTTRTSQRHPLLSPFEGISHKAEPRHQYSKRQATDFLCKWPAPAEPLLSRARAARPSSLRTFWSFGRRVVSNLVFEPRGRAGIPSGGDTWM